MADEIHVGDIGTVFTVTLTENSVAVDISSATVKQLIFKAPEPDGTVSTKTALFTTDGHDGKLSYTTIANDLNRSGVWKVQAYVEVTSGKWHSSYTTFTVYPNL